MGKSRFTLNPYAHTCGVDASKIKKRVFDDTYSIS